ncbi:ribonuclease inhibitor-like [Triplophysa dalaica]|uniref:ribonuclease inhibitor-like n=1 Tax=Triplophysa dalaica TaxID=1582913 RepID=UPI0024DF453C|nr:ribonuclease inhibitor-like [Triplophysa dalaica]
MPIKLQMSLDQGRKPEYPEEDPEARGEHANSTHTSRKRESNPQPWRLRPCGLTDEGLVALTSALNSNPSHLRKLDLSVNPLRDSGVEHLCALLSNSQFRLKTLDLSDCSIKKKRRDKLISALCSNPSHLRELNLSGNKIKDTGVKLLCRLLEHSQCKLEKLNLYWCNITDVTALADTLAQTQALSFLKVLDLRHNKIKEHKLLREVLKRSNCELM